MINLHLNSDTLQTHTLVFEDFVDFLKKYITLLFSALLSLSIICYLMSIAGMGAGENGNKTRLNLALGMEMNHCEWEGMGLKKIFPPISTVF